MLALRHALLRQMVHAKFKGVKGVLQAWPIPSNEPHRTTLWRWLKGKTPRPERVLELAGAFDFDPFALFERTPRGYAVLCRALAGDIGVKRTGRVGVGLEWIHDFVAPSEEWPPQGISSRYFHRHWNWTDFRHTGHENRNYFQRLDITSGLRTFGEPQVWHFAFKVPEAAFPVWTPYGFVEKRNEEVALYHYRGGYCVCVSLPRDATHFGVETWFGLGAAQFRVASLHPFKLVLGEGGDDTTPCVRFR
jgi:hypothetical protein